MKENFSVTTKSCLSIFEFVEKFSKFHNTSRSFFNFMILNFGQRTKSSEAARLSIYLFFNSFNFLENGIEASWTTAKNISSHAGVEVLKDISVSFLQKIQRNCDKICIQRLAAKLIWFFLEFSTNFTERFFGYPLKSPLFLGFSQKLDICLEMYDVW